jgi:hypothetical protein
VKRIYTLADDLAVKTKSLTPAELRRLRAVLVDELPKFVDHVIDRVKAPIPATKAGNDESND